jgi:hypothetical protein
MKRILSKHLLLSFFLFLMIFLPEISLGGPGDPACDPICNCYQNPDGSIGGYCPIDSNLYILLGIGVVYGLIKVKERSKVIKDKN